MSTTAGTMSTSSFLPKYIRTYVYKHGDLEWQQVHQSHLELPSQFGWVVKMKRDPGVFMTWSVPDVTSSTRATWAHWHCSSAAPLHHLHLFIYPEADFSSIQLGESLRTSGSQQCWLGPDQSIESILNQNLLCLFFFFFKCHKNKELTTWEVARAKIITSPQATQQSFLSNPSISRSALHETHLQVHKSIPLLMFVVLGLFSLTYPPLISLLLSLLSNPPPHVLLHWGLAFFGSGAQKGEGERAGRGWDESKAALGNGE